MKKLILIVVMGILTLNTEAQAKNVFDFQVKNPRGNKINLSDHNGKSLLVVNIATRCGYTGQLDDLEKLHKKYQSKGLVVIGVPSNDFGGQTPEKDQDVVKFCKLNYGVTFPLTSKVVVTGKKKTDFISHLVKSSGGDEIGWNFEKFLFDKKGKLVKRFPSSAKPLNAELEKEIKAILN